MREPAWALGLMRITRALAGSGLPSTVNLACAPTLSAARFSGGTAASNSSEPRSTISRILPSTATRSPGCARRCDTRPLIGVAMRVSANDFFASSTPASAACKVAWAPASDESEVSSAVGEMKPWATSALLLVDWRLAMSNWVRAAIACCSA